MSTHTRGLVDGPLDDPEASARAAHLRYVNDSRPGIRRVRHDKSFRYLTPEGGAVDPKTEERILSLGIPPAYENVWICPIANGHLQATGRDARGRKQYRYHPRWREIRDSVKYDRMIHFGQALPRVRAHVDKDLSLTGLPRRKVLATIVRLLEKTRIRVGNEEYARENDSFGLTTLRSEHVDVERGGRLHFHFRGKSGKHHDIDLKDARVARVVSSLQDLDGQELFHWTERGDDGEVLHKINSGDVNAYLHEVAGDEFTAKDFRTWSGTILCAQLLAAADKAASETQGKHVVSEAIKQVSQQLGNTPSVCRKCYVNPVVVQSYLDGSLSKELSSRLGSSGTKAVTGTGLTREEQAVLEFLRRRSA